MSPRRPPLAVAACALLGALLPALASSAPLAAGRSQAGLHRGDTWYSSEGLAAERIETSPKAKALLGAWSVDSAECEGLGHWIWNRTRTLRLYKHFACLIAYTVEVEDAYGFLDFQDEEVERVLHVLGRFDFTLWRR